MVVLTESVVGQYERFSLFNSPYPMHREGRAIDLYPADRRAVSPVKGMVVGTRTVTGPASAAGSVHDHVIVIETESHLVRVLHVDPGVQPGAQVEVGDVLGYVIESGFFAPWVDPHLHVGFRPVDANPYRATGSLPMTVDVPVESVAWDGQGIVRERGETYIVVDSPEFRVPREVFAGVGDSGVIDGGFPHYDGGGVFGGSNGRVSVMGVEIGRGSGNQVVWHDMEVTVNGEVITGISFVIHRGNFGVKLVSWDGFPVAVGEQVQVTIAPCA